MPLAKTAEQATEQKPITDHPQAEQTFIHEGIPIDLYSYFSASMETLPPKDKDKLKDIYEWAKSRCEEPTLGNIMERISVLDNQLGLGGAIKRYDRLWNWVRLSKHINDLDKRRKALERQWL